MQIGTKTMYPTGESFRTITQMGQDFDRLQVQLASGKKASSLSELGSDRSFSLTIRGRLTKLDAYNASITTVNLRLNIFGNALTRLDQIEADSRAAVSGGAAGSDGLNMVSAKTLAKARLDEVLAVLNTDINGRYLFSGKATDVKPVPSMSKVLDGDGLRDGFAVIAQQRKLADAGSDNLGRLNLDIASMSSNIALGTPDTVTLTEADLVAHPEALPLAGVATSSAGYITVTAPSGAPASLSVQFDDTSFAAVPGETVTISVTLPDGSIGNHVFTAVAGAPSNANEFQIGATPDDTATNFKAALDAVMTPERLTVGEDGGVPHPFGLKLSSVSADGSGFTVMNAIGDPAIASLQATGTPTAGDKISFSFQLPDGSYRSMTLTATNGTPAAGEYAIGATGAATLANVQAKLDAQIKGLVTTDLATISTFAAADSFFNGHGQTVQRVGGPDYANSTTLINADPADTVIWYNGADDADPRAAVSAKVDDARSINHGAQANESGTLALVRSLAALSVESFDTSDPTSVARFNVMRNEQMSRLSESKNGQAGSIEIITLELGIAQATAGSASDRHQTYGAQLTAMRDDIESVSIEEAATQLLQLKTRLEASFQVMSLISQLTLVNYMR